MNALTSMRMLTICGTFMLLYAGAHLASKSTTHTKTFELITDNRLSSIMHNKLLDMIRAQSDYSCEHIAHQLVTTYPNIKSVTFSHTGDRYCTIVTAHNPIIRLPNELIILDNAHICEQKFFRLDNITALPYLYTPQPLNNNPTMQHLVTWFTTFCQSPFASFYPHWYNAHTIYLQDPEKPHCGIMTQYTNKLDQHHYTLYQRITSQLPTPMKHPVVDMRFDKQMVVYNKEMI